MNFDISESKPMRFLSDMVTHRKQQRSTLIVIVCLVLFSTLWLIEYRRIPASLSSAVLGSDSDKQHSGATAQPRQYTQTVVVASIQHENTEWVEKELPNINHAIYVADNILAPLHPDKNKGHESGIYLQYIVDHYHNLSDTTIFTHSGQEAWHNNDLFNFDLALMIRSVSNEHVQRAGYFNLRCHHESGCPDHIKPHAKDHQDRIEEQYFVEVWEELHGPDAGDVPEILAVPCCSQFAASRDAIQSIPLERWQRYKQWMDDTNIPDRISGRIWEFTWHYIFTRQAVLCPSLQHCYCDGYGLCFHDDGEIYSWMAMKEIQMLTKEVMDDFGSRGLSKERLDFHYGQRMSRPLTKWLREAELRGQDPYTKALLSGRAGTYKEGDGL